MSSAAPRHVVGCLRVAAGAVRDDPVGLLLPAAGSLLLATAASMVAHRSLVGRPELAAIGVVGAAAAFAVGGAVLRSRLIAVGARAVGLGAAPWGRPAALLGVWLIVWPLTAAAWGLFGVPLLAVALAVVLHGWITTGAVLGALGLVLAAAAALAVRALFAFAPAEVVVARRSAVAAVVHSVRAVAPQVVQVAALVLVGDLAVGLGAVSCGAGALPGYPIADLAVLHRWRGDLEAR